MGRTLSMTTLRVRDCGWNRLGTSTHLRHGATFIPLTDAGSGRDGLTSKLICFVFKVDSHYSVWANVCQRFECHQNETKRR